MLKKTKISGGLLSLFLTAAVLLCAFFIDDMFPFGWGTVSWCDMNQQLIPLFCDFKDILAGEKSLFLNFSNAGGMNFYGVFFFFLSSPFTFLAAFVEKSDIPFLMNILVILKLCVSAFTASFTLQKTAKSINPCIAAALGSVYSLCGYAMLFYQNIMWLDMMYLFPLIMLGIYKLIEENRPATLVVTLTLSVIFNFYISFMIFLFVILFFGVFACFYKNANRKIYVNLSLCGLLSLLASSVVWVPCLLQYLSSARGNGFMSSVKNAGFFARYETTLTVLLCSGIIFAGLIFTLLKNRSKSTETKLLCLSFFLTCLPLLIEPVNLMWHTGSYMSFPARYGFIPVFLGLMIAAKQFPEKQTAKGRDYSVIICLAVTLLSVFAILFTGKNTEMLSVYTGTLYCNQNSFKGQLFICIIFTLCYILIYVFSKKGNLNRIIAALLLCVTVFAEGLCSTEIFMTSAKDKFSIYNYQSMLSLKDDAQKEGFYRVNTTHKITDANMTGAAGFNSLAHYTSLNDQTYMEAAKKLGYSGYWMETGNWGGNILSDALLSVGYTVKKENEEFKLVENPFFIGLGIKTKGAIPKELEEKERVISLGKAYAQMFAAENPIIQYEFTEMSDCTVTDTEDGLCVNNKAQIGTITYKLKINEPQTLYFDCYNIFSNKLNEEINQSLAVYVNGNTVTKSYPTQRLNGNLRLGRFANTEVNITIEVFETVNCTSFGVFGIEDSALESFINNTKSLNLTVNGGKISGLAEKGSYFISIPFKSNYRITLSGQKINYSKALSGFIAVDIPYNGELEITFVPKGFYLGLAFSAVGIILIAVFIILSRKNILYSEKIKNIIYGVFLGGCAFMVLWVYIIPIVVNLSDLKI